MYNRNAKLDTALAWLIINSKDSNIFRHIMNRRTIKVFMRVIAQEIWIEIFWKKKLVKIQPTLVYYS